MRAVISLVAVGVIRNADGDQVSIFNLVEGIAAEGFPLFVPNLSFFVLWEREPNEPAQYQATLNVRLDQRVLLTHGATVDFQQHLRNRSITNLAGLVIPRPGQLVFEMMIQNGPTAAYAVTITASAAAQAAPARVQEG